MALSQSLPCNALSLQALLARAFIVRRSSLLQSALQKTINPATCLREIQSVYGLPITICPFALQLARNDVSVCLKKLKIKYLGKTLELTCNLKCKHSAGAQAACKLAMKKKLFALSSASNLSN